MITGKKYPKVDPGGLLPLRARKNLVLDHRDHIKLVRKSLRFHETSFAKKNALSITLSAFSLFP